MGRYTKSLTLSNSERILVEATFSRGRYISVTICFTLSLLFLLGLLGMRDETNSDSFLRPTSDDFLYGGIFFMYPFVLGCIKLRNKLSQELALTNKRLIIKTGAFDKDTYDIPINIIQSIQIKGRALTIYSINGSVVKVKSIKNILQIKEAIQELLDTKDTLSHAELQTQALLGISQLNFKKEKSGCLAWAFWLALVPLMGSFFGMLFRP